MGHVFSITAILEVLIYHLLNMQAQQLRKKEKERHLKENCILLSHICATPYENQICIGILVGVSGQMSSAKPE